MYKPRAIAVRSTASFQSLGAVVFDSTAASAYGPMVAAVSELIVVAESIDTTRSMRAADESVVDTATKSTHVSKAITNSTL